MREVIGLEIFYDEDGLIEDINEGVYGRVVIVFFIVGGLFGISVMVSVDFFYCSRMWFCV